jgi:ABC-type uncharacterized transport system permease subunit
LEDNFYLSDIIKMESKNTVKPFGIVRHLDFLKENIILMFKYLGEYKASFYSVLFEQFIYLFVNLLLFSILFDNFADVVGWSFKEFILFLVLVDYMNVLMGIFIWKYGIRFDITSGDMNLKILRPMRTFWFHYFHNLSHHALLYSILNIFIYFGLLVFFDVAIQNTFVGIVLFLLVGVFWITLVEFF